MLIQKENVNLNNKNIDNLKHFNKIKEFLTSNLDGNFDSTISTGTSKVSETTNINSSSNKLIQKNIYFENNSNIKENKINEIFGKKYKTFEALENLLINDENDENNDNNNIEVHQDKNNNVDKDNKNKNKEINKKILSVPKLDFSNIYNDYKKNILFVKEINNEQRFSINQNNHYHHHLYKDIEIYKIKFKLCN